ncbi:MAG TPA: hypothetical protein PLC15_16290 [Candidatus Obscuribacter sp.]|nr:hypothetical protein [Candidatus Obscuribacter sp.]HNB16946.1 hypothetical protein [Candidatus Obscuribacter sp.]HND06719.1 hypothetical protein [Candidatus Obscuribacter sp.]HNG74899.1 hypothetical protein [Candidatus Obscuribacter sp.]
MTDSRANKRKPSRLSSIIFGLILILGLSQPASVLAQNNEAGEQDPGLDQFQTLSPSSREMAIDLGIQDDLTALFSLRARRNKRLAAQGQGTTGNDTTKVGSLAADDPDALQIVLLRQEINETILSAVLELRVVISKIDNEITAYNAVRSYLEDRRDRSIRLNNISNFIVSGALNMISNGLEIPPGETPETVGAMIGVLGGATSTGISAWSLKIAGGEKRTATIAPNMLAKVFGLPTGAEHDYPRQIWRFFTNIPPGSTAKESRKERLMRRWLELKRIDGLNTAEQKKRVALLCSTTPVVKGVDIDVLEDREAMLSDVKATLSQMFNELLELMTSIHSR